MKNPIIKGHYADPDVGIFGGKIYVYPTTDGGSWEENAYFKVFVSEDLKNWTDEGIVLDFKNVPWTEGIRAWAPAICEKDGKYYLYYSGNFQIGVAVSDTPSGKFIDKGYPLIEKGKYAGDMIDPDVFIDDDQQAYLYWGNSKLYVAKLEENMIELASEPVDITPPNFTEAICVFKRKGIYYYTWSFGNTCKPDYHVRYGKGVSPMQKPEGNEIILHRDFADDRRIKCTGHHTILNIPNTDEWYILYHRFDLERCGDVEEYSEDAGTHRELCINRLCFDENGNILPINPNGGQK